MTVPAATPQWCPVLGKLIEDYLDELRDQARGIDPDGGARLLPAGGRSIISQPIRRQPTPPAARVIQ